MSLQEQNLIGELSTSEATKPSSTQVPASRGRWTVPPWLVDLLWPSLVPWSPEKEKQEEEKNNSLLQAGLVRIDQLPNGPPTLISAALDNCRALAKQEDERRQSVESRLTTILGLASVASAIIFGVAAQALKTSSDLNRLGVQLFGLVSAYIALQLLAAVFAAVRGLGRHDYQVARAEELLPLPREAEYVHAKRQMKTYLELLSQNSKVNSGKVDQMAIAHRAVQNFVGGMLLLTLLLLIVSFWPHKEENLEERLIQRLRSDPQLIELLRGPRGSKGDQGPPGATGAKGDRGPAGPPAP